MPAAARRPYALAVAPAFLLIALFYIAPAIWAVSISMTPLSLVGPDAGSTRFIGLDNYRTIWSHPDFPKFVWNTAVYTLGVAVVGSTLAGLLIAVLIDRAQRHGNRLAMVAFGAVVIAGVCPVPLAGSMWGIVFDYRDGVLNGLIGAAGFARIDWLGDYPMLAVIVAESWRMTAVGMFVFYGALQTLPVAVSEAARLDGATSWRRLWTITLPQLKPIAGLVALMTTMLAAGSFVLNEVLTGGGSALQTETIALYSYHSALIDFRIAYGAALSVIILLFTACCAVVYLWLAKEQP